MPFARMGPAGPEPAGACEIGECQKDAARTGSGSPRPAREDPWAVLAECAHCLATIRGGLRGLTGGKLALVNSRSMIAH